MILETHIWIGNALTITLILSVIALIFAVFAVRRWKYAVNTALVAMVLAVMSVISMPINTVVEKQALQRYCGALGGTIMVQLSDVVAFDNWRCVIVDSVNGGIKMWRMESLVDMAARERNNEQ